MRQQQSLGQSISCSGVGLHTGLPVTLTLRPAPPDTRIVFVRHGAGERVSLGALVQNLVPTELCTAISLNGTSVKTIEHVLAALVGLEVDNVFVELDAEIQAHAAQDVANLAQRFLPKVLGRQHLAFRTLHQIANRLDAGVLQTVIRTH